MLAQVFLYGFVFLVGLLYVRKRQPCARFVKKIGGPHGLPLLGNALDFINNFENSLLTLSNWVDKYGSRVAFNFGPAVTGLLVNDAIDLETILSSTATTEKSEEYDMVKEWLGEGLITSKGRHWIYRRKLLTPTFHFAILENFIAPINAQANILLDVLHKNFIIATENNEVIIKDINPFIARCTLDIICETAMGKQMHAQAQLEGTNQYVEAVHKLGEIFQYRSIRPWLRNNFLWKLTATRKIEQKCLDVVHSFTDRVIAERKLVMNGDIAHSDEENSRGIVSQGKVRLALLDLLLEAQRNNMDIPDSGIREETTTFIFAGHDTVAQAVSFCLFNIGNYPEVQEKLHRELDVIFKGDNNRHITTTDLKEMKYLECCIKESMRLYPSVPIFGRLLNQPFKLDEDVTIPEGVTIFIVPYKLHRNSKYFPKSNDFIPERFATGSCMGNRNPFAYIPFSAGPRNCIGQKFAMIEAKILLATILRRFKIKSKCKPEEIILLSEIVLRSKSGIEVQLEERH